jgi:epoxyqueuosine reductase
VVLGNSGDVDSVPALAKALEEGEAPVRAHAAWALGRLGGREALAHEEDPEVLQEIEDALSETAPGP